MTVSSKLENGILTVIPVGRLDSATGDDFAAYLEEQLPGAEKKVVIDLADVDFISSKGLRIFVSLYKKLDGRALEMLHANESVKEIFRISGFLNIFHVS